MIIKSLQFSQLQKGEEPSKIAGSIPAIEQNQSRTVEVGSKVTVGGVRPGELRNQSIKTLFCKTG